MRRRPTSVLAWMVLLGACLALSPRAGADEDAAALARERETLVRFYRALGGPNWIQRDNWASERPVSEWHGVGVDEDGYVVRLTLYDNNLEGTLTPEIRHLTRLHTLHLSFNRIAGALPPELGECRRLRSLWLKGNAFRGQIPPSIARLPELDYIDLHVNQFEGVLPVAWDTPKLRVFRAECNAFAGPLPAQLFEQPLLQEVYLFDNQLGGPLPETLEGCENLARLLLSSNQLEGPIPEGLGRLEKLVDLRLDRNRLTGAIPESLASAPALQVLRLDDNRLSGVVPQGLPGDLVVFDVAGNPGLALPLEPAEGPSLEVVGARVFEALRGDAPAALGTLSATQEDVDWIWDRVAAKAGIDVRPELEERLEEGGEATDVGAVIAQGLREARTAASEAIAWPRAEYGGIDWSRTTYSRRFPFEVDDRIVHVDVPQARLVLRVKAGGTVHEFTVATMLRDGGGWFVSGPPEYTWPGPDPVELALDLERARTEGRIAADADPKAVVEATVAILRKRLERHGPGDVEMRASDGPRIVIALPPYTKKDAFLSLVGELLTDSGDVAFRITVRPKEDYRRLETNELPLRLRDGRTHPWRGSGKHPATCGGFEAFKGEEIARWKAAEAAGTAYVPSDPRYRLVLREGATGREEADFALLEEPEEERFRFGATALTNAFVADHPATGAPVVNYEVRPEHREAFAEWTEQNIGLPLAIVVNGRFRIDPTIMSKLTDTVQVTLGSGKTYRELRDEAERLVATMSADPLPVPLRIVPDEDAKAPSDD